jgi:NAD(P)-dependent dehydrogenase (short-subunit alcohol dehydrogenase family)
LTSSIFPAITRVRLLRIMAGMSLDRTIGRWAKSHEMAGPIVYLASDAASFVTGTLTLIDGSWTAVVGRFSVVTRY